MNWKLISGSATVALVLCAWYLAFRRIAFANGPLSGGIQAGALLLMVWARITFGLRSFHATANPTKGALITTGPYRYVRHPIYAAILCFFCGALVAHPAPETVVVMGVLIGATAIRIAAEEKLLQAVYPEYVHYAQRTARLIPFVL